MYPKTLSHLQQTIILRVSDFLILLLIYSLSDYIDYAVMHSTGVIIASCECGSCMAYIKRNRTFNSSSFGTVVTGIFETWNIITWQKFKMKYDIMTECIGHKQCTGTRCIQKHFMYLMKNRVSGDIIVNDTTINHAELLTDKKLQTTTFRPCDRRPILTALVKLNPNMVKHLRLFKVWISKFIPHFTGQMIIYLY